MGIRPGRLLSECRALARAKHYEDVSERYLWDIRNGRYQPSEGKIRTIVAALRRITLLSVRASDVFDVEPATTTLSAAQILGHPDPWRTQGQQLGLFWFPRFPAGWRSRLSQLRITDPEIFEKLYTELAPIMLAIAYDRWGVPRPDAEALVHDVFTSFLVREPNVDNVQAYLFGATRLACLQYWRRRGRSREEPMPAELADRSRQGEGDDLDWELRLAMIQALATIGPRCLETLQRFYLGEESAQELAERLGVSRHWVYQILYGCRKQLRLMVFGEEDAA
ncbi:MAG TPA: sigma-70 family RNA polymerase sigma factor [Thermoanaerobaculia bacterium]